MAERMKMKINSKDFHLRQGQKGKLNEWPTFVKPFFKSQEHYTEILGAHIE